MTKLDDMINSSVLAAIERSGQRPTAFMGRKNGVARSNELVRIERLPRRLWDKPEADLETVRMGLNHMLWRPWRPANLPDDYPFELWKIQAAALRDIHDVRGAFLPISAGAGKAMISIFAPLVCPGIKRPVLLVPADLREQTNKKVIPMLARAWRLHPNLKVIGYSELSLAKNRDMLERLEPDMIIADEVHCLRDKTTGRTKRVTRYMRDNPHTVFVAMSGTITEKSLKDYHHIIQWCLGEHWSPLPTGWKELCTWADALDDNGQEYGSLDPGALEAFCGPGENARQGFRRRLVETPGVVASGENELGVALVINELKPEVPPIINRMLQALRERWEDPNGDPIVEAIALWRIARQIALGFWYEWVPPAPDAWMDARKAWKFYVRETLTNNRRGLDTELPVWTEQARAHGFKNEPGKVVDHYRRTWRASLAPDHCEFCKWETIKDTFVPNPVAQWIDFFFVDFVRDWLKGGPGIIWVEHVPVGERLSRDLGIQYFGAGKKASLEILDAPGNKPIIASIKAHKTGKNLQQFNRGLITAPPSSNETWEQTMARQHRHGQKKDQVTFDVPLHAPELYSSFENARSRAVYQEDTLGARQRLNYATITF